MHNFTAHQVWRFVCECGEFEFIAENINDQDKIRKEIDEHRQHEVFREGNSYKQKAGDDLIEKYRAYTTDR